jgi:hypothetical protein
MSKAPGAEGGSSGIPMDSSKTDQPTKQAKGRLRVDGPFLKGLIAWMQRVAGEATITLDAEGLRFAYMDPSHVAMAAGRLTPQAFAEYAVAQAGCFAVDLADLAKALKGVKKGVEVGVSVDEKHVAVSFDGETVRLPVLPPSDEADPPEPKLAHEARLRLMRGALLDAVRKAGQVSDQLVLKATPNALLVRAFSETGDYEKTLDRHGAYMLDFHSPSNRTVKALYGASFLEDLLTFPAELVTVEFSTEKPVALTFEDYAWTVRGWLAPRIGGEYEPRVTVRLLEGHPGVYDEDGQFHGAQGFKAGEIATLPRSAAARLLEDGRAALKLTPDPAEGVEPLPLGAVKLKRRSKGKGWLLSRSGDTAKDDAEQLAGRLLKALEAAEGDYPGRLLAAEKPYTGQEATLYVMAERSRKSYAHAGRYGLPVVKVLEVAGEHPSYGYTDWKPLEAEGEEAEQAAKAAAAEQAEEAEAGEEEGGGCEWSRSEEADRYREEMRRLDEELRKLGLLEELRGLETLKVRELAERVKAQPGEAVLATLDRALAVHEEFYRKLYAAYGWKLEDLKEGQAPEVSDILKMRRWLTGFLKRKAEKPEPKPEGTRRAKKAWVKIWLKRGRRDRAEQLADELGISLEAVEKELEG